MSENKGTPASKSSVSPEEVSQKLDYIIRRLDALERLILEHPEYEGLAAPLRITKMGLGLYEEPLRLASELKTAEHAAKLQANLIFKAAKVRVGENFSLGVEIVNSGESSAQLIRIENLIPEGFKFMKGPKVYRMEENHLDLKGRLLDPLSAVEIKLLLRPLVKGVFVLKPKIFYMDKNGELQSHESKPVTITVKELGISGWIRCPR